MTALTHADVQRSLARHLRIRVGAARIVVTEVALSGEYGSEGRFDVVSVAIGSGYKSFSLTGFEVKATRQDLMRDIDSGKWRRYPSQVNQFAFAVPRDLADDAMALLPSEIGVIACLGEQHDERWGWRRAARKNRTFVPDVGTILRIAQSLSNAPTSRTRGERVAEYLNLESMLGVVRGRLAVEIAELTARENAVAAAERRVADAQAQHKVVVDAAECLPETFDLIQTLLTHVKGTLPSSWGGNRFKENRERMREIVKQLSEEGTNR